jgi:hypothetical protein
VPQAAAPAPANGEGIETKDGAANGNGAASDGEEGGDDMFTDSPIVPIGKDEDLELRDTGVGEERRMNLAEGFTNADNWDDAEGYFRTRPGELMISRYLVNRDIGSGVYSSVVSAMDQKDGKEVAIKVVRSNETMFNAGRKEIEVLKRLGREDPDGKKHICKLLSHFEYKNHLCMVFVPHEMNLRKLLKTYGREVILLPCHVAILAVRCICERHTLSRLPCDRSASRSRRSGRTQSSVSSPCSTW